MKFQRIAALLGLTALFAVSCAPQAAQPPASAPLTNPPSAQALATDSPPQPTESAAQPAVEPTAVFVPRGDKLEATDPSTVVLASGGLQLVEFFRFT